MMSLPHSLRIGTAGLILLGSVDLCRAQAVEDHVAEIEAAVPQGPSLNFYGAPGLIDMPSGMSTPDGRLSFSYAAFGPISRSTLSFQITPRLSGSFRYSGVSDWNEVVQDDLSTYYDRSFDLRYRLTDEGQYMPAITIGLQDFIGTGIYAAEYLVASKHLRPNLTVTAGLGWGRLGSYGSTFSTGTRPDRDFGLGGEAEYGEWFRGPAAPFAGMEWSVTERLALKAEYSSDNYDVEAGARQTFERSSPFNFGVEYQASRRLRLGAYSLYGSEVGVSLQYVMNPKERTPPGIGGPAPQPLAVRPTRAVQPEAWSPDWATIPGVDVQVRDALSRALASEGIRLDGLALGPRRVTVQIENLRYDAAAQAIGRTARLLAAILPASVEVFEIIPLVSGMAASKVTLNRTDLEDLEFAPGAAAQLLGRAEIGEAGSMPEGALGIGQDTSRFTWAIEPFARASWFDPAQPYLADLRLRAEASYEISRGLYLTGSATKKIAGNLDNSNIPSDSVLPHVRSDAYLYNIYGDPELEALSLGYYRRLGEDLYGRVTVGYLERMFGGISSEVLWSPVDSQISFGAELNYVVQRDFETDFSFQDYDVFTGHVSAYYDFDNGFLGQIDVGRYLAGDLGATLTIQRYFANGWRVGAFATLTDVTAEDFGEGSFDKGILLEIPLNWLRNTPTRDTFALTIRPITADGGARLNVGRLYQSVRDYHAIGLESQWSRVWR